MPNNLFIDTSGWASIFIPTETHYPIAAEHFRTAIANRTEIITTNYVIAELVALLNSPHRLSRDRIFNHINIVRQNPYTAFPCLVRYTLSPDTRGYVAVFVPH